MIRCKAKHALCKEKQELTISPAARHSAEDNQSNNDALRQGADGLISLSDFPPPSSSSPLCPGRELSRRKSGGVEREMEM
jgi:hypothetical protein